MNRHSARGKKARKAVRVPPGHVLVNVSDLTRLSSPAHVTEAYERLGKPGAPHDQLDASNGTDAPAQVAAEQVIHLLDAWRYFSSAINAYLCNATDNAIHFAYYAELRSAMSLFAGSGIRVRYKSDYFIDASGKAQPFDVPGSTRTHTFVWKLWEEWIESASARDLMGRDIKLMQGLALNDLASVPSGAPMLKAWGYDFFAVAQDHTARNSASYEAKGSNPIAFMPASAPELVESMWSLLLFGANGILFDTALIRYFVEKIVDSRVDAEQRLGKTLDPKAALDSILEATALQANVDPETIRALFRDHINTNLFELASDQSSGPENILCRAFFLLRFATLSVSRNLSAVRSGACQQWIRAWLSQTGLFDPSTSEPSDLETDYRDALEAFNFLGDASLPRSLWSGATVASTTLLSRAEGFLGWGLPV